MEAAIRILNREIIPILPKENSPFQQRNDGFALTNKRRKFPERTSKKNCKCQYA
jgi:hypothetical protein